MSQRELAYKARWLYKGRSRIAQFDGRLPRSGERACFTLVWYATRLPLALALTHDQTPPVHHVSTYGQTGAMVLP